MSNYINEEMTNDIINEKIMKMSHEIQLEIENDHGKLQKEMEIKVNSNHKQVKRELDNGLYELKQDILR